MKGRALRRRICNSPQDQQVPQSLCYFPSHSLTQHRVVFYPLRLQAWSLLSGLTGIGCDVRSYGVGISMGTTSLLRPRKKWQRLAFRHVADPLVGCVTEKLGANKCRLMRHFSSCSLGFAVQMNTRIILSYLMCRAETLDKAQGANKTLFTRSLIYIHQPWTSSTQTFSPLLGFATIPSVISRTS